MRERSKLHGYQQVMRFLRAEYHADSCFVNQGFPDGQKPDDAHRLIIVGGRS
jgi:hypothetical protein